MEITGKETIWPVNPTRNFIKNLIANVPKTCKIIFDYNEEPVEIIIYWFRSKKEEDLYELFKNLKDKCTKALWFVISKTPGSLSAEILKDIAAQNKMAHNKTSDFTKDEYGIRFVYRAVEER
ncbi:hypothetical protein A2246_04510 [candidate division WOR-1 bacterium RIFOXYA2_FULL_37_7]|uniref:Uncharacterized protein n=1 Tax=candidate division WOR-1 bacterium RIFOXYB2_FULL_37_13 TaxID=1802579 RepID=A0A1F4SQE3_UNCSA|nr:MAG: hypothetical protein A2246_04510 [candidate division WOR-1 bacterium RIFOXYA2_FULL_37_7]OGC22666.1 MAG: hypothetical protein A2310_07910 [candidate division WOR-1 bacterium RIFOXYB2_FULL_37_13]